MENLAYKDEVANETFFDCPRCRTPHSFDIPDSAHIWCCDVCDITLHYPEQTFLEILTQVQKKYVYKHAYGGIE